MFSNYKQGWFSLHDAAEIGMYDDVMFGAKMDDFTCLQRVLLAPARTPGKVQYDYPVQLLALCQRREKPWCHKATGASSGAREYPTAYVHTLILYSQTIAFKMLSHHSTCDQVRHCGFWSGASLLPTFAYHNVCRCGLRSALSA